MKENQQKQELARLYYMQGEQQKVIAEKLEISPNTMVRWVKEGHWDTKRAAMNITRPEIVNKILALISKILEKVYSIEDLDIHDTAKIITQIEKLSNSIEKLDKHSSVVDNIETFRSFNHWMENRMKYDENLSAEFIREVAEYQDKFISEQVTKGKVSK
ncbi:MAG: DUF1804 family protein [Bacteroidales bacterium]|nr:DUF1804 family protein [Bacteroidales bacterium]